jgi:hypothetical protein
MPERTDPQTPTNGPAGEEAPPSTGEAVPQNGPAGEPAGEADPAGSEALGDPGKKALDAMKAQRNAERDRRRALEAELEALKAPKPAEDGQPTADEIRTQAAREANAKANARILKSEIRAAAAGKLADPADALAHLDLSSFEVDENGDVDAAEISDAITDLLTRKPYLAANGRPVFQGSGDGGAARKASGPSQLTRQDLQSMTPEAIHKAKAEGRLKNLLSGK